jgi:NADP-dependent 3-hydroxy acid dehydrogenase YdfG
MALIVWLVTGTTSGIGATLIDHIVAGGDKAIASGRKVEQRLSHLKSDNVALLELDITAGSVEIDAQVKNPWNIFGDIDVLMNNGGMSVMKSAEEVEYVIRYLSFPNSPTTPILVIREMRSNFKTGNLT